MRLYRDLEGERYFEDSDVRFVEPGWAYATTHPSGDSDGDGLGDVLINKTPYDYDHEPDVIYLFPHALTGDVDAGSAPASVQLPISVDWLSSAGDLDADGWDDLVIGTPVYSYEVSGGTFLFYGPISGSLGLTDADEMWLGRMHDHIGVDAQPVGDTNGDGVDDLIFGVPGEGLVLLFFGELR